jgi:hypothetical protein
LLGGFNAWLGTPSVVWWGQIEVRAVPEAENSKEGDMYRRLTAENSQQCVAALFEALEEFLSQAD